MFQTHVLISTAAMSLSDTKFWRAVEFLPERFLPDKTRPAEFDRDRRNNQKPFGLGPRSCIGQSPANNPRSCHSECCKSYRLTPAMLSGKSFALAEMRLVLARLVWKFDLGKAPGKQVNWNQLKTYVVVEKRAINITLKESLKTSWT